MMNTHRKLNTKEAAALYNLAPNTLERWRCQNRGPKYARIGRRVLYDVKDLEAFFAVNSVDTSDSRDADQFLRDGYAH